MLILEEVYAIKYKNDCIDFNYRHNVNSHDNMEAQEKEEENQKQFITNHRWRKYLQSKLHNHLWILQFHFFLLCIKPAAATDSLTPA